MIASLIAQVGDFIGISDSATLLQARPLVLSGIVLWLLYQVFLFAYAAVKLIIIAWLKQVVSRPSQH